MHGQRIKGWRAICAADSDEIYDQILGLPRRFMPIPKCSISNDVKQKRGEHKTRNPQQWPMGNRKNISPIMFTKKRKGGDDGYCNRKTAKELPFAS